MGSIPILHTVFGIFRDATGLFLFLVCNGFGSVLGALQLILYAIYRNNKGHKDEKPAAAKDGGGSTMEMGLVKRPVTTSIQPPPENTQV